MTSSVMERVESGSVQRAKVERMQQTIGNPVVCSGVGLHTGRPVTMHFLPAPEGTGIVFRRMDLPTQSVIPARLSYVQDTVRSTTIGLGEAKVSTVEHVLAAVRGCNIDNLVIALSSEEPPVGDGSAKTFVDLIETAGVTKQQAVADILEITKPIYWSEDPVHLIALPYDGFRISYTAHHPHAKLFRTQYLSLEITRESFIQELASSRTFCFYRDLAFLWERGLAKGGSLDNAVVIKEDTILSHENLRFPDEPVRHKILDLIGDLALFGRPLRGHFIAICSGHRTNIVFAKKMERRNAGENSGGNV